MNDIKETFDKIKTEVQKIKDKHIELLSDIEILIDKIEKKTGELDYMYQIQRKIEREKEEERSLSRNCLLSDVSDEGTEVSIPTKEYFLKYGMNVSEKTGKRKCDYYQMKQ